MSKKQSVIDSMIEATETIEAPEKKKPEKKAAPKKTTKARKKKQEVTYGSERIHVHVGDVTCTLEMQAARTNRVFPGSFTTVEEGEAYTDEWSCPAKTADGTACEVYWEFHAVKGCEPADEELPWDDGFISRIETK